MKILILSDLHLTNKVDPKKFDFINSAIEKSDKVILNGDFWDRAHITFDEFLSSDWSRLFPLLKEKNAVYLYGNHDLEHYSDERRNLFSSHQAEHYKLDTGHYKFHIEHGHRVTWISEFIHKYFGKDIVFLEKVTYPFKIITKVNSYLHGKFTSLWSKANPELVKNSAYKKWAQSNLDEDEILIIGHTHAPEVSLSQKFINSGYVRNGFASCLVIENDKVELLMQRL